MGWQEEAREVRDGALALLTTHGDWIAPSAFERASVKTRKAIVGDFQLVHRMPDDTAQRPSEAGQPATVEAKPYVVQIWWKGRPVAHIEWSDRDGPLACRSFTKGEWRDDMVACVHATQPRSRYG